MRKKVIGNQRSAIRRRLAASFSGRWSLIAFNAVLSLIGICFPAPLRAQDIGNVGFRSVSATLANGATCNGSSQIFATSNAALNALGFKNLGQTSHLATATSNAASFTMEIDGIDTLGNVFRLSDLQVGTPTSAKGGLVVTASGYMTNIQVAVVCTSGATFSVSYSGSFSPQPPSVAGALLVATDKLPFQTAAANATASTTFQSPSGNSGGTIIFQYSAGGPAGSSITAQCVTNSGTNLQSFNFPLTTVSTPQFFQVSQTNCPFVVLTYTSGGASAVTYNLEYVFNQSGTLNTLSTSNSGPSATLPIQVVSDAVSQAFTWSSSASNPGANQELFNLNANSGAKTIYLDKLYVYATAATTVSVFISTTPGSTCNNQSSSIGNLKFNSSVASIAQALQLCSTGSSRAASMFVSFPIPANGAYTFDLRGYVIPAGTTNGIVLVNPVSLTGTSSWTVSWYER